MNEDQHLNNQIEKHLQEQEDNEEVSECCGVDIIENIEYDECSKCGEACRAITLGEFRTTEYENAMYDKADEERENDR